MTYLHAVVLGLVQGLTEFLPVSSSGHLILVPHVFGWPDQGLTIDAALHLGTLAALVAYFRAELIAMLTGALSRRLVLVLMLATIPAAAVGMAFGTAIEANLRSPLLIATTTAFWAGVMWVADRRVSAPPASPRGDPLEGVGVGRGLAIGCAQAIALVPGTSRSGITITTGLLSGLDRETAARFAFLLGIPITTGVGLVKSLHLLRAGIPAGEGGPLVLAILTSFVSGWFAVWFLVRYLRQRSLLPFVLYRLVLSAVLLAVFLR